MTILNRAKFSARLPEQIFLKRLLRLHEESFSPDFRPLTRVLLERVMTRRNVGCSLCASFTPIFPQ